MDVQKCTEAPKLYKLISYNDLNVQVLLKSFLEKFQTTFTHVLLIASDRNKCDLVENHIKIGNEIDKMIRTSTFG